MHNTSTTQQGPNSHTTINHKGQATYLNTHNRKWLERTRKLPKGGCFGSVEGRGEELPFLPQKQSHNQLKEDRFWPPKHGSQQHKGRKEEDTSFLRKLTRKMMSRSWSRALLKRNQEGEALDHAHLENGWRRKETHHFIHIKWRKEYE